MLRQVLVLKLIVVPMLFMLVAVPVMMPLMMLLMPMMQQMMNMMSSDSTTTTTTTTTAAPASRRSRGAEQGRAVDDVDEVLQSVLTSHRCLERIACKLGTKDKASPYRKPITWYVTMVY